MIEIAAFGVKGGEAGGLPARVEPDNDFGAAGPQGAQMAFEPGAAGAEVNAEASFAPRRDPQIDERGKIGLGEIPERAG